ncbi:MAG: helix-turn-helix domain-containing protein [Fimbriimonadaceae bacterium]
MNLADAIRRAASKGLVDVQTSAESNGSRDPFNSPYFAQEETSLKNDNSTNRTESYSPVPEPPVHSVQGGNAVRLEIFLNGEQMAGMLKAIMAGQHSVLTLREAASYLRVGPKTLEKLVDDGEIPAVEIDGRYRFPKSNLDDWLAHQSAEHEEEKDVA